MLPVSRRRFLTTTGAATLVPVAGAVHAQASSVNPTAASGGGVAPVPYLFFTAPEAAFVEAAVTRLIPPDELGPSAVEAGVPAFIDKQLGGAWGAGERLYRSGPWQAGKPTQGYQLPFTPAELFRTALQGLRAEADSAGRPAFERLGGNEQDAYLDGLQKSRRDLGGVPSDVFFDSLLAMTIEGYFCDPVYGGNRDMAAWRMIGFPGAYGAYYDSVDQYGVEFRHPPRSLAENGSGVIHLMPDIPATAPAGSAGKKA